LASRRLPSLVCVHGVGGAERIAGVALAEHGWRDLMATIDLLHREIVGSHLELRCRAKESIVLVGCAACEAR
jgi:hypothetical protein